MPCCSVALRERLDLVLILSLSSLSLALSRIRTGAAERQVQLGRRDLSYPSSSFIYCSVAHVAAESVSA